MGKIKDSIQWLEDYSNGCEMEQSKDKFNWFPLDHEPVIGDGWHYQKKLGFDDVVTVLDSEHSSDDAGFLPDDLA